MFRHVFILGLAVSVWPAAAAERVLDYAEDKLNEPPAGFRSALSGQGQPGDWRVILDDAPTLFAPVSPRAPATIKRRVLAQLSRDPTDHRFPLLILEEDTFEDFSLTTAFKLVEGNEEQMAGIAFRLQDEQNYYYIRASALGTNLSFFKMQAGQLVDRRMATVDIPRGEWHELSIECRGNQFRGRLNGQELLHVTDTSGPDAYSSGKLAFWTKSDSVSYFADTRITYTRREPFAQVLVRDALEKYPRLEGLKIFAVPRGGTEPRIIASHDPNEIGQPAGKPERTTLERGVTFYGKSKGRVLVTLPLHDKNGDTIAAVKVVMKSFPGQTEQNAIVRALPIVKRMEVRVLTAKVLTE